MSAERSRENRKLEGKMSNSRYITHGIAAVLLCVTSGCSAPNELIEQQEKLAKNAAAVEVAHGPPAISGLDVVAPDPKVANRRARAMTHTASTPETRRAAIIMVHFGTPDGATPTDVYRAAFTNPDSMHTLYYESSFGKLNIEGDVFGWYQIAPVTGCDTGMISQEARDAATAAGVDLSQYDHLLYYFTSLGSCTFGGLGELGTPANPARQTWYNGWYGTYVLTHELGHNLGHWHSRSYSCGELSIAPNAQCNIVDEYGDPFDPMGRSTAHFAAFHKAAQGWIEPCGMVTPHRNGVFSIKPIERSADGALSLRVPMDPSLCPSWLGSECYYYIEYRQPIGSFDGGPDYISSPMHQGVLIRTANGIDLTHNTTTAWPALLDMTPEASAPNFQNSRLGFDDSFQDPTGLRIAIQSNSSAEVKVAVGMPGGSGSPRCLDSTPVSEDLQCYNGVRDHGETDVDCGGPCVPCDDGRSCSTTKDCWNRNCASGTCQQQPKPLDATLRVYSEWNEGFCGDLTLVNNTSNSVMNWRVRARFADSRFTNTWNANYTPIGSSVVEITPVSWNQQIWPHSTAYMGYCAAKTGPNYMPQLLSVESW